MKKPHEQEWMVSQSDLSSKTEVQTDEGVLVARVNVTYDKKGAYMMANMADAKMKADLLAAAPDMARALLAQGHHTMDGWHTHACIESDHNDTCEVARAAIKKAGVLP